MPVSRHVRAYEFTFAAAAPLTVPKTLVLQAGIRSAGLDDSGDVPMPVGDGLWDVEVARRLGWRFADRAAGCGDRLRRAGATIVLSDFADVVAVDREIAESTTHGIEPEPAG